jgi:drug/metabolite transporter (DMT)-like permease
MKFKSLALFLLVGMILIQTASAACMVNGKEVPCSSFPWWIFVVIFAVAIFFFIFWIRMLVHAIKTESENKAVWIILIVLLQVLGAIIYYFAVKRKSNQ